MPFIDRCPECPYGGRAIGTRGDPASRIVLVGEAPGATEIVEGEPFRGPAGRVLSEALVGAELVEADLFITNSVACQPCPVHPWVTAIDACRERLLRDLEARGYGVIVTLGATALRSVTERRGFRMRDVRGRRVETKWGPVVPTFHPARVMRVRSERPLLVEDLALAGRIASSSDGVRMR
jgi:uracil-DNA glycosylase